MPISVEQCRQFAEDGYFVVRGLFDAPEVAELEAAMRALLCGVSRRDRSHDTGFDPWTREDGLGDELNPNRCVYLNDLQLRHPRLDAHLRSPQLADIFAGIWGTDVKSWQAASVIKPPHHDMAYQGWHQDMPDYWPLSDDRNACAITYLSAMGATSGGTSVIPGSHTWPLLERTYEPVPGWPPRLKRRSMRGFDPCRENVVAPDFAPGDVLVFHSSIAHKANNNEMDASKIGLINVYQAAGCEDVEGRNEFKASELPITQDGRLLSSTESLALYRVGHPDRDPTTLRAQPRA